MRRALIALLCVFGSGCSVDRVFVDAVDGYAGVVLPEYAEYVKNDARLDADAKRIRLQTAERFRKLVDEAKER